MSGVDSYSTTPLTNSTCDGGAVNWAENQPPSTVNNSARQVLADVRSAFNDAAWFQYGTGDQGSGNIAVPGVYASTTSFTIAGVDVTAVYHIGRRVRAVGSLTGTIYGAISASAFSTNTTVTVVWDSGALSNETLVISLSQIPVTGYPAGNPQKPRNVFRRNNSSTGNATSSTSSLMQGFGSVWVLTPTTTGVVKLTFVGFSTNSTTGNARINAAYGTGSAPAADAAFTGTAFLNNPILSTSAVSGLSPAVPVSFSAEVTGLTVGTAYWFDATLSSSAGSSQLTVNNVIVEEI